MKPTPPITFRPLETALVTWAAEAAPELEQEWHAAKNRQDQARAVAKIFKLAVDANLNWLTWAATNHADDLRALMPYVGSLQQTPRGWSLPQYLKALDDCPI